MKKLTISNPHSLYSAVVPIFLFNTTVDKIKSLLYIFSFFTLTISCQMTSNYHVELVEINEQGVAIFKVLNNTDEDISSVDFELTFSNADKTVVEVDTIHYSSNSGVFLKARGETIIAQKMPYNTTAASAKIISTTN